MSSASSGFENQDQVRLYLTLGISAAKEGDVEQAQSYLERVLRLHPDLELRVQALMWLSRIAPDTAQKHAYLEQLLAFDPGNPEARREWAILEGRLAEDFRVPRENAGTGPMADKGEGKAEKRPSRRFSCPNCGGSMRFDPWRKKLACYYCGKMMTETEALEAGRLVSEGDFVVSMATGEGHRLQQLAYSVVCSACGASFVLPKGHFSGSCPFCASHLVVQVDLDEDVIPPHGILPFRVDEAGAKAAVQEWLGKSR